MKPISGKWLAKGRRFDDHLLLIYFILCRWLLSTWGLNMHYPSAQREMKKLGSALARHTVKDEAEAVSHLWGRLGILLQRGNAAILGNRVPMLPHPNVDGVV